MKLWERIIKARLRAEVSVCEMPRKSTTDGVFALRMLIEKYIEKQRELHCVFVDLEKAYDRVPMVLVCIKQILCYDAFLFTVH